MLERKYKITLSIGRFKQVGYVQGMPSAILSPKENKKAMFAAFKIETANMLQRIMRRMK